MNLRNKIKKWLFKEEFFKLEELLNTFPSRVDALERDYGYLKSTINNSVSMYYKATSNMIFSRKLLEECKETMNSICDVGVDVGFRSNDHSWAVICVHGKKDYVKFVPMCHEDIREITRFLKRFEYSNRCTDSPLGYAGMDNLIAHF